MYVQPINLLTVRRIRISAIRAFRRLEEAC